MSRWHSNLAPVLQPNRVHKAAALSLEAVGSAQISAVMDVRAIVTLLQSAVNMVTLPRVH